MRPFKEFHMQWKILKHHENPLYSHEYFICWYGKVGWLTFSKLSLLFSFKVSPFSCRILEYSTLRGKCFYRSQHKKTKRHVGSWKFEIASHNFSKEIHKNYKKNSSLFYWPPRGHWQILVSKITVVAGKSYVQSSNICPRLASTVKKCLVNFKAQDPKPECTNFLKII
jgi:hypothetical protein